jgi:AbrB family looped-hinge helix DNA binding protein
MRTARVTSKGQIVIPADIRTRMGIEKGSDLIVEEHDDALVLRKASKDYFDSLAGLLRAKGSLTKELLASRKRDRKREDR